ncbi:hypothetical protein ACFQGT_16680 [Natrialbaceae archaeon GCM10025810]|uniref:hypothetical protein n=1 Tax=Halovalidus salilacus TaxID=3075124 RepID=UPI0036065038
MGDDSRLESLSPTDQIVLLTVAERCKATDEPVQTFEVRQSCVDRLRDVETAVIGTITEADVMRSLYELEDADLVSEVSPDPDARSPTGKGRPSYALVVDPDALLDACDDDLVDAIRED